MNNLFKKSIIEMSGYSSPPQTEFKVKLNQNESPFDLPDNIKKQILNHALALSWNRYPEQQSPVLKEKLAQIHNVKKEQIILGNGSNQLLNTLFSAAISNSDTVLHFPPTFSLFDLYIKLFEGKMVTVYNNPDEDFPIEQTLNEIDNTNPKLILLCSPNNPTGYNLSDENIDKICTKANNLVLLDRAYYEFCNDFENSILQKHKNLILSYTFSKAFSTAGLRFGYFIASEEIITEIQKANIPFNINCFTELTALTLLEHIDIIKNQVEFIKNEREKMYNCLKTINKIHVYKSHANFLMFKCQNGNHVFNELKKQGILIRNIGGYPLLKDHLRVSIGFKQENDLFINALKTIVND